MKELVYSIIGCFIILVLFVISWVVLDFVILIPIHNYHLHFIEDQFTEINTRNLAQSRLLSKKAAVDHWGNSNLCDYYAGQFRASTLSQEEIKKNYEGLTIPSYKGDENSPLNIEVIFLDEEWFKSQDSYYWSDWWEENSLGVNLQANETPYLVFVSSDSHPGVGDIRCN